MLHLRNFNKGLIQRIEYEGHSPEFARNKDVTSQNTKLGIITQKYMAIEGLHNIEENPFITPYSLSIILFFFDASCAWN